MISLGISAPELDKLPAKFDALAQRQIPYATSLALNRCAQLAMQTVKTQLSVIFDRPNSYTLNSLSVKFSTKNNLVARVEHKDFSGKGTPASKYLMPEIEGGATRTQKRSEVVLSNLAGMPGAFWVPAPGAPLDGYGNIRGSLITQILSAVGGLSNVGYQGNRTASSAKRKGAQLKQYVLMPKNNPRGIAPGVYQRKASQLVPILFFVDHVTYKPIYDMEGIVNRVVEAEFDRQFSAAMDYALSTATISL